MDVIGARFADQAPALAARDEILSSVAMPPTDIGVRPLGSTQYADPIGGFVLAGRFEAAASDAVVRVLRDHGGTIIARRSEWRPRPATMTQPVRRPARSRAAAAPRKRPRRPAARLRVRAARVHRCDA